MSRGCIFTFLCFSAIVIIKCVYAFSHSIRISYMLYSKWRKHPTFCAATELDTLVLSTGGENFLFPVSWLLSNCNLHTHDSCSVKHLLFLSSSSSFSSTVHLCHLIFYSWLQSAILKSIWHCESEWMSITIPCQVDFIVNDTIYFHVWIWLLSTDCLFIWCKLNFFTLTTNGYSPRLPAAWNKVKANFVIEMKICFSLSLSLSHFLSEWKFDTDGFSKK